MFRETVRIQRQCMRKYRLRSFIFDLIMVAITGGLWLIWIFVREMRRQY